MPRFPGDLFANGKVVTAAAFMIVSNIYTTVADSTRTSCGPASSGVWSLRKQIDARSSGRIGPSQ